MNITIKSLIKGSSVMMISSVALRMVNFLLLPLYSSLLSPAEYGAVNLVNDLALFIYNVFSFAIDWSMGAFFHEEDSEKYRRRVFTTSYVITLTGAVLCLCAGALSRPLRGVLFGEEGSVWFVFLAFALAAVRLLYFAPNVNFRLRSRMTLIAVGDGVTFLINAALTVYFLLVLKMGYWSLMLGPLAAEACKTIVYFFLSKPDRARSDIDWPLARRLLRYSIPIMPTLLLAWVTQISDQFILNIYHGQAAIGLYGVGAKIMALLGVPASAFRTAYTPYAYANANKQGGPASFARIANLVCVALTCAALLLSFFAREVVGILYATDYQPAYPAVGLLVFSHVYYTLNYIINYGLSFKKRNKMILLISAVTAVVNVISNFLLIPAGGFVAAAFTTCISYMICLTITYFIARRQYPCPFSFRRLLLVPTGGLLGSILFMDSALWLRALVCLIAMIATLTFFLPDIAIVWRGLYRTFHNKNQ